jgi:LmbE family N-acetylglucosaminyl deacetylase
LVALVQKPAEMRSTLFFKPTIANFIEYVQSVPEIAAERRSPSGQQLTLLQPHFDDAALSVGGIICACHRPVELMTIFSDSDDAHVRRLEDAKYCLRIAAHQTEIGCHQGSRSVHADSNIVLAENIDLPSISRALVMAPLGVGGHPDHAATRLLAENLGAAVFWEDVAFWGIYGSSIEDRQEFGIRHTEHPCDMILLVASIDDQIDEKIRGLRCYPSQSKEVWRVVRYSWAVAHEHGLPGGFAERLFVRKEALPLLLEAFDFSPPAPLPAFNYGGVSFECLSVKCL